MQHSSFTTQIQRGVLPAHLNTPLPLLQGVHWGNSYRGNGFSGESDWATTKMAHYMQKGQQPQKCPLVVQRKQQHVSVWLKRLFNVWLSSISGNGLGAFLDSLGWPHRNQPGNRNKLLPAATCSIITAVSRAGHTRQRLPNCKGAQSFVVADEAFKMLQVSYQLMLRYWGNQHL